ncbi:MAG: MarR family transcriptional regulator [Pseudopedobacter saltans]|uniref:MarR family transcriptional regulator n=1 Tax=Pseudopedobacter saltans TaxID=151895 RepID=A0A2W5F4X1_9SPHI|nr:MAG: MarR family transcriptional regulator [Pseudopedobacter saltans]
MGFQNCLEKKKFRNEYHQLMMSILVSSAWVNEKMKAVLLEEDITLQQYNILSILHESDKPLSILQIREAMVDKMSDTSRIVDRLVAKDMVHKCVCAMDKRLVDISIAENGNTLLCRMNDRLGLLDETCSQLDSSEVKTLITLLDKMRGEEL